MREGRNRIGYLSVKTAPHADGSNAEFLHEINNFPGAAYPGHTYLG